MVAVRPRPVPCLRVVTVPDLMSVALVGYGRRDPAKVREGFSVESPPLLGAFRRTPGNSRTKVTGHRRPKNATTLSGNS